MESRKKKQQSYSVCIRTLGTAGEKYAETLNSIKRQTIQPEEIIVVIPHGYELPKERIGSERFVRTEKGMVNQRVVGLENVNSKYTLALDDDVRFEDDFVEKLIDILEIENADFVSPSILDIENITSPRITRGGVFH